MPILNPATPTSTGNWRTADGSTDPEEMRSRVLRPEGSVEAAEGSGLISGVGRILPAGPAPEGWRANEPAGWTTAFDADMNYTGTTTTTHPFFDVDGSPLSGQWPVTQAELFTEDAFQLLSVAGGPTSSPYLGRFIFPAGLHDGERSAILDGPLNDNAVGVYYAYTMRLSDNWSQGGVGSVNGVKHVEVRTTGGPACRTNIGREVSTGGAQYGIRFSHVLGTGSIPRLNVEETRFAPGQWITVEALLRWNSAGANTGQMSVWVDGVLAGQNLENDIPKPGTMSVLRDVNVFGGGISDVPNDQHIDIGHYYASGG